MRVAWPSASCQTGAAQLRRRYARGCGCNADENTRGSARQYSTIASLAAVGSTLLKPGDDSQRDATKPRVATSSRA
eukprot:scaffold113004_cov32-Tisochrysis_lutea.AAC.8